MEAELRSLGLQSSSATNLRNIGRVLTDKFEWSVPGTVEELLDQPGVGIYIANPVLCFALGKCVPLVDTNIGLIIEKALLNDLSCHLDWRNRGDVEEIIAIIAVLFIPPEKIDEFYYALIDL
jgi:A/G-specific adenine glycosylase